MDRLYLFRSFLRNQFALDLRSLACFRIGLGALICADVALRLEDLTAFYTDQGIIPRSLLSIGLAFPSQWSFQLMNGTATFQLILFAVTAIAAGMLACGYRTPQATIICWLMLVSLHTRNPLILNAGDKYLELLTFWGIFLPLGGVWSIDARRLQGISSGQVSSLATFAIHVQIALVYLCTGLLKYQVAAWQTGDAIRLALSQDYLVSGLGQQMLAYPRLLSWLTHATLCLEIAGPIVLVVSRSWLRLSVVVLFVVFHLGLALCFTIGLFPFVCIVALFALLPSQLWRAVLAGSLQPAASYMISPERTQLEGLLKNAVIGAALLTAVWSNLESLQLTRPMPEILQSGAVAFRWPQGWRLFVDLSEEEVDDGWFVFHAQFANGMSHDLLSGASPVSYDKPALASATFPNFRWRKLCSNLQNNKFKPVATYLGEYLLMERDRTHHDVHELTGLQISYVKPVRNKVSESREIVAFGRHFATGKPVTLEVLYQWNNEARKYHDVFIRE